MEKKELPEACKICIRLAGGVNSRPYYDSRGEHFQACSSRTCGENACLPKDRAMIVLLYKLLQAQE